MKLITYSKIGYNHPSQANWSYGIWKIDLINTKDDYCISYTVKETFGGDSRFRKEVAKLNIRMIETKGLLECPKITGVSKMMSIESDELLDIIKEFKNS